MNNATLQQDRFLLRSSLHRFIRYFWDQVDPVPFEDGPHIGLMCAYLEAVSARKIRSFLCNIPPGHQKSLTFSVFWPAWEWANRPKTRFLCTSYSQDLALRDSDKCRLMLKSDRYQSLFPRSTNPKVIRYQNTL